MEEKDQKIEDLKNFIVSAEDSLEAAKKALFDLTGEDLRAKKQTGPSKEILSGLKSYESGQIIEGIFNGENMVGPESKVFPVPANYASKSKLVEGDRLKLTIAEDGSFIFKQIGPIERKKLVGNLEFENNAYHVSVDGKTYNVLYASVTYFKAKPGDKVTIIVPEKEDSNWAALENIIHDLPETANEEEVEEPILTPKEMGIVKEAVPTQEVTDTSPKIDIDFPDLEPASGPEAVTPTQSGTPMTQETALVSPDLSVETPIGLTDVPTETPAVTPDPFAIPENPAAMGAASSPAQTTLSEQAPAEVKELDI